METRVSFHIASCVMIQEKYLNNPVWKKTTKCSIIKQAGSTHLHSFFFFQDTFVGLPVNGPIPDAHKYLLTNDHKLYCIKSDLKTHQE